MVYPNPAHPINPAIPTNPDPANPATPVYFSVYVCIRINACLYGFFYVCIYAYMQNLVNI